jgi:hypothetical protein
MCLHGLQREWEQDMLPLVREMALGDPDQQIRALALETIGSRREDPSSVSFLIDALRFERVRRVRMTIGRSLAENGSEAAFLRLKQAAEEGDLPLVAAGHRLLLRQSSGLETPLLDAYRLFGYDAMRRAFLDSANPKLVAEVQRIEARWKRLSSDTRKPEEQQRSGQQ